MTRLTLTLLALLTVGALFGCATAPVAAPTPSRPPSSAPNPTAPTPVPASSARQATPSATATAAKKFATAKLPTQVLDRRADQVAQSAGGQTAAYYKPMATSDVIVAALSPAGTAADAAQGMAQATRSGPATCGTLTVSGTGLAACVVPLEGGYLLVNASGSQTVAEVGAFTLAVYETFP